MRKLFEQFSQLDFFKKPRENPPERFKDKLPVEEKEEENYEPTLKEEEWLLKEQEGKEIKPRDPKKEARENKKAFKKFKKSRRQKDLPY